MVPERFDVSHHFEIDPLAGGYSRLRQFEHFPGVQVPIKRGVLLDTQAAFEPANRTIKQRAESVAAHPPSVQTG